jgi:hypothetical protein
MNCVCLLLLLAAAAFAQSKIANPGFAQGALGSVPPGWFVPPAVAGTGFGAKSVDQNCHTGSRCAMLTGVANPPANSFGNLMQNLPAASYNRRRIRPAAASRVEGQGTRAQMWLRLDRADNSVAFLENMGTRPVTSAEWKTYDITTTVPEDASRIVIGVMLIGAGNAWVDDFSLEILDEVHQDKTEPARPLTPQGLTNLTAFARLYGYVRFFHPSDQAALTDWENFAIDGVRAVEDASSVSDLQARLENCSCQSRRRYKSFPSPIARSRRCFRKAPRSFDTDTTASAFRVPLFRLTSTRVSG